LKNGGAAGGGLWVVFKLAELDATEDVTEDVEVALEDAAALDSEVELVAEVLGVVVAVVALVVLVVEDFCAPFGTENPTTPPMTTTTMTITANAVVLRPGRPFLGDTILPPRPTAMSLLTVPSARQGSVSSPRGRSGCFTARGALSGRVGNQRYHLFPSNA